MAVNSNYIHFRNFVISNWNADGIERQRNIVLDFLIRHRIDILCVSETHLLPQQKFAIPGFKIYRSDRHATVASGGVAIVCKNSIKSHCIPIATLTSIEAVAIQVECHNNEKLNIISTYKPPNKTLITTDLEKLFCDNTPTLLLGDLNCKNTIWGCRVNNPSGLKLYTALGYYGIQLSPPTEWTHFPYRIDHQPDILSVALHKNFRSPLHQTVVTELDSDHLPVLLTFTTALQPQPKTPKLINGKIDWDLFKEVIQNNLKCPANLQNQQDIDNSIDGLLEGIKTAITTTTSVARPYRTANLINTTPEIQHLIHQKHKTRKLWQETRNPKIKLLLNQLTRRVRNELEIYRIHRYQNYIASLEPQDPTMWRATKKNTKPIPCHSTNKTKQQDVRF